MAWAHQLDHRSPGFRGRSPRSRRAAATCTLRPPVRACSKQRVQPWLACCGDARRTRVRRGQQETTKIVASDVRVINSPAISARPTPEERGVLVRTTQMSAGGQCAPHGDRNTIGWPAMPCRAHPVRREEEAVRSPCRACGVVVRQSKRAERARDAAALLTVCMESQAEAALQRAKRAGRRRRGPADERHEQARAQQRSGRCSLRSAS